MAGNARIGPGGEAPPVIPHFYDPGYEQLQITAAEGPYIFEDSGTEYLDFQAQLSCVNVGHDNDAIAEAMAEQLDRAPYVRPFDANDTRAALARELVGIAPGDLSHVFFAVSGSEANEAAIQLARQYTGASTILTRWRSYHGGTYATGGLSGDTAMRTALERNAATTGNTKFLPPLTHQSPFTAETPEELGKVAADHLEFVVREEGPDHVAGILMEPVAGSSGAFPTPPGYFERVREICDTYDVLLIADEVITGFGRCGEWFGVDTEGVVPDLLTFAKGVTSAYAPLGGVLIRDAVAESLLEGGVPYGQTFAGHPVACAAGVAAIEEYRSGLIENVRRLAPVLESELRGLAEKYDVVGEVRGRGLLWGVEFSDPETGEPFLHPAAETGHNPVSDVAKAARERGVVIGLGRPASTYFSRRRSASSAITSKWPWPPSTRPSTRRSSDRQGDPNGDPSHGVITARPSISPPSIIAATWPMSSRS